VTEVPYAYTGVDVVERRLRGRVGCTFGFFQGSFDLALNPSVHRGLRVGIEKLMVLEVGTEDGDRIAKAGFFALGLGAIAAIVIVG
jgi:hypothetical protein